MIRAALLLTAVGLGGCASSLGAGLTGGAGSALEYQSGVLQQRQTPDGKKGFSFVIPANAFAGEAMPPTPEERRLNALANKIGTLQACPGAYKITSRDEIPDMILYNGVCL